MKKRELEIALRAAARVARETEFFVIGTQAVHALKDLEFVGAVMGFDMANLTLLRRSIGKLELPKDRAKVRSRLRSVLNDLGQP
jgi:hypothetical protein